MNNERASKAKIVDWYRNVGYKHPLSHHVPQELVVNIIKHIGEAQVFESYSVHGMVDLDEWGLPSEQDLTTLAELIPQEKEAIKDCLARLSKEVGKTDMLEYVLAAIKPLVGEEVGIADLSAALEHKGRQKPKHYQIIFSSLVWWHKGINYNSDTAFANKINLLVSGAFDCVQGLRSGECDSFLKQNHPIIINWLNGLLDHSPLKNWATYSHQHFPPMRDLTVDYKKVPLVLIDNDPSNPCYRAVATGMTRSIAWVVASGYHAHMPIAPKW